MKYYIIAGEASGDLHGEMLMREIKRIDNSADFRYWGGENMDKVGGTRVKHYRETAFMGFFEIIKHYKTIKNNFEFCYNDLEKYNPNVLILIDYPGFNLRIAKYAKEKGFKVIYYIAPKIWAWKTKRVEKIKKYVDRLYAIFPFEVDFYKKHGYDVDYIGNPLIDKIEEFKKNAISKEEFIKENNLEDKEIIALLPGSRKVELEKTLNEFIPVIEVFKNDYQFVMAGLGSIGEDYYRSILPFKSDVKIIFDKTYELLNNSKAAIVVSGTAVLETALFKVPQVAFYKVSFFTYMLKPLLKIKYFTLPNIIMQKQIVKELLQKNLSLDIIAELNNILSNNVYKEEMIKNYDELYKVLSPKGAPKRAAMFIYDYLTK